MSMRACQAKVGEKLESPMSGSKNSRVKEQRVKKKAMGKWLRKEIVSSVINKEKKEK